MKLKLTLYSILAAAFMVGCASQSQSQAELAKQAKISKDAAIATALARVPNGTIKESEIEKEGGKLIWSFDVATPGTKDITEVNVDAMTGSIVAVSIEKAAPVAAPAKEPTQAELTKQAKITKQTAIATALKRVPNGTIKDSEIENEGGKLIWSFDVATPGTKDITEVNVDAMTGAIIAVSIEKAAPTTAPAKPQTEKPD